MVVAPAPAVGYDEADVELWDGEEVVKGQPRPWHEAVRLALLAQLYAQRRLGVGVVTSSAIEDAGTAPRSDGSVIDTAGGHREVLVWVEVLSPSDLCWGDERLSGGRRRHWLLDHGVASIWAVVEVLGTTVLVVFHGSGEVETFASPATVNVTVAHSRGEDRFEIDLAKLAEAGEEAGDDDSPAQQ